MINLVVGLLSIVVAFMPPNIWYIDAACVCSAVFNIGIWMGALR